MHALILWVIYMVRKQFRNRRQRRSLVGHRQTVTLSDDAQLHRTRLSLVGMLARRNRHLRAAGGAPAAHPVGTGSSFHHAREFTTQVNGRAQTMVDRKMQMGHYGRHNLSDLLSQFVTKMTCAKISDAEQRSAYLVWKSHPPWSGALTSHNLFVLMIMDSVPLARLAVLLALALAASATVGVLVAVPVFHLVAVPVPLPVGYLRWEVLAQTRIQPVSYDLCSNSWCSSAPSILSTPLADLGPVHRCCRGSANCTTRH
jgi:hypothetical protein